MKSLLEQFSKNNFLITCSKWFTAPDGRQYNAVWGKVSIHNDTETLGIKTNAQSANWYAVVGEGEKLVIVAGCQIHYACVSKEAPFTGKIKETRISEALGRHYHIKREGIIYLAQ